MACSFQLRRSLAKCALATVLVNESSCHRGSAVVRGFPHARQHPRGLCLVENSAGDANHRAAKPVEKKERMLRTPSIFGPLNSGFVPFASGAPIDEATAADAETETAEIIERVSAPPVETAAPVEVAPRTAWAPASSARIRVVEALVVAGVCAYFGFGLLSAVFSR
jgi:hypothetical protein